MNKKIFVKLKPTFVTALAVFLLLGCDYHQDSVYLGREEAEITWSK